MTTAIKRRRGTTAQHATFTGLEGEITVDTTKDTLVVHDGATAGGFALLREDLSNNTNVITTTNTKTLTNKTFGDNPTFSGGTANGVVYLNGSKVATTGSALTFDGANLGIGISTSSYKLHVRQTAGNGVFLLDSGNSSFASIFTQSAGDAAYFGTLNNFPVAHFVNGSERMRIDSSGNVGIGTSSPSSKLYVGASSGKNTATFNGGNSSSGDGAEVIIANGGTTYGGIGNVSAVFGGAYDNTVAVHGYWGLRFYTTSAERMRIDYSGALLVGTTSSDSATRLRIVDGSSGTTSKWVTTGTGLKYIQEFYNDNGAIGRISVNGTATSYATSSDYRLKENIQPMQNALGVVVQLNPVTYTWKADGSDGQGFIAHELQAVVPDCVTGEKDAVDAEGNPVYQGIDTSFLVATLTKAIQELKAEVDSLKAQLENK